jgi:O-Antigen ligase
LIIRKSDWIRRTILVLAMLISGGNLIFPRLPLLICIVFLYLVARDWVIDLRRNMLPIFLLLSAVLLLTILRTSGADIQSTAIRYANFIAGILMLDLYLRAGSRALIQDLYVIGKFMAWQALITMVLAHFFGFMFFPIEIADTLYSTVLGIFNYHMMIDDSALRPDGFFYEPGVFQIYLNVFLYLALFVFRNWRQVILAVLAVLSTQSTTGVVIAFAIIFWFIAMRYMNRGSLTIRVAKVAVAALVISALAAVAALNIQDKMTGDNQGSFWARQYDLLTGVNIIAQHPLAGIGFDYAQYYRASAELGYADTMLPDRITMDRGNSNGIIFLFYSIGIPLAIPFLIGMFRQSLLPDRALVGIILFLGCLGESLVFTPFFLMFIYSGLLMKDRVTRVAEAVTAR